MAVAHETVGSGDRQVIALPGWFGSARGWGPFPDHLDGTTFTYVFPDYRGYGARKGEAGDYTMAEISADVLALADDLGWRQFDLIGHSMGGMAIQRVLADAPDRVGRMVALNPVPASGIPFDEQGWGLFAGAADDPDKRAAIIDLTTGNRLTSVWIDAMVRHSLENSVRDAFAAYLEAWAKTDFAADVQGKQTRVKVIVGEHDPALSAALMEQTWLPTYPNAELEVFPNAGHYPMYETPVALATSIEAFLAAG